MHLSYLQLRNIQTGLICQGQCKARKQLTHPSSFLVSFPCRPEVRLPGSNQRGSSIQTGTGGEGGGQGGLLTYKNCFFPGHLGSGAIEF